MWKKIVTVFLIIMTPAYSSSRFPIKCFNNFTQQYEDIYCEDHQRPQDCCDKWFNQLKQRYNPPLHHTGEQPYKQPHFLPQNTSRYIQGPDEGRFSRRAPYDYNFQSRFPAQPSLPVSASSSEKFTNWIAYKLSHPHRSPSPQPSSSGSLSSLDSMSPRSPGRNMVRVSCIARSGIAQEPVVLAVIRCTEGDQEHYQKECENACSIKAVKFSD